MRRSRAFSLIEFMVAMMIFFIIGGGVITSFWVFVRSYETDRDYTEAREEIEFAFQLLARDITNISLGMPNNKAGSGDFSEAFSGVNRNPDAAGASPIMFFMGEKDKRWGGPILLRWHPSGYPDYFQESHKVKTTTNYSGGNVYIGNELIYVTAIPVVIEDSAGNRSIIKVNGANIGKVGKEDQLTLPLLQEDAVEALVSYKDEGRNAGIVVGNTNQRSPRSWIVLPGLQIPLLIEGWSDRGGTATGTVRDAVNNALTTTIAPYSTMEEQVGMLGGFEEVHLVKVARIFVNGSHQLVQEIYGDNFANVSGETSVGSTLNFLAENIASAVFIFDPDARTLTTHLAAMGADPHPERGGAGVQPAAWPVISSDSSLNDKIVLSGDVLQRRLVVGSRTWRIRN